MHASLGLPWFGSELWFGPEPSRTGPWFHSGFGVGAEPDQWSGLGFRVGMNLQEPFRTGLNPEPEDQHAERARRVRAASAS